MGLQEDLEKEQILRYASEAALREEMHRAMKVCSEQVALRTDFALASNSRGEKGNMSGRSDSNGPPQPRHAAMSQDLARLRHEVYDAITRQEGRLQAAEKHIALHLESLEQVQLPESQLTPNLTSLITSQGPSPNKIGNSSNMQLGQSESATMPDGASASRSLYHSARILRQSLEARGQGVESRADPAQGVQFAGVLSP